MSSATVPAGDFFLSLTGYDEIAVAKHFGGDVNQLRGEPFRFLRALVFVHQRRDGLKDAEAFKAAQEISIGELQDYFPDEETDLDPEDPDTPAGKEPSASG